MGWSNGLRKEWYVQSFTVPATSGSYAFEKIRFGGTASGQAWDSFQGVTAWFETGVTDATCELWLAKLTPASGGEPFAAYENDDFVYAGQSFTAAEASETWVLAGCPAGEIRVKSGGTSGTAIVAATLL